ncbi:MAG: ABC transporter substrate-binding protein [Oscillospiraceae bacterium]|nr:ABC transporter substrate-binding protein [Oscillospiraceae bacterium]MDD6503455.1 ABC transporter substrate-binding protein [Oscillospiraceae bacterium]
MKKWISLLLAVCMLFTLVACGGSGDKDTADDTDTSGETADAGTYVFGGIGPLTGEAAIYGNAVKNGAQIAVDEINALGGVQIELKFQDDVADGETAVNAYNKLLDDGMQVLVGPVTTGSAIAVSAKLYEDRVFGLTPSASSPDVTSGKDNMFQLCFTDPNQGVAAADYIAENRADSTVAVIYRNDDAYSQGIRDAFVAELKANGMEAAYEGTFTKDTATDFSVQLTAAQSAGADLVFLPIYYQPASVILSQADAMGYAPTFFGVDGMDGILTLEGFDTSLAEGVTVQSPFSADATDDATVSFVEKYVALAGETPNQFAADGYDCVYALYNALNEAGCTPDMSAEDICEALVATFTGGFSVDGLTGSNMTWSANGEVSKAPNIYVITDGKYVAA